MVKKPASKKRPVNKNSEKSLPATNGHSENGTEPLSNFQTPKTGRKDPSINEPSTNGSANGKANGAATLTIEKVKLVKGEFLRVDFSRIEADATTSSDCYENKMRPAHKDCKAALAALSIHLALMCDYLSTKQIKAIETYDADLAIPFHVTGVSIGGGDDDQGVVLTGHKIRKDGKAVILNTPFTRFEESDEKGYRYIDDLQEKIEVVIDEAKQYLNGKRGEDVQTKMDFPPEEERYVEEDN